MRRIKEEGAATMKKSTFYLISLLTILLGILYAPSDTFALDAPHDSKAAPVVPCAKCHYSGTASGTPPWVTTPPSGGDNTKFNILCNSCHNNATPPVPVGTNYNYMKTHSSFQTSTTYGTWNMECTVCHNSHWQRQARAYPTEGYLFTGATTTKTTTTTDRKSVV